MELTFNKVGNHFVSEFQVVSDCNLHLEKPAGSLKIKLRTTSVGEYEPIHDLASFYEDRVIDTEIQGLVYPKWIKIESSVEPTMAVVSYPKDVEEAIEQHITEVLKTPL